MPEKFFHLKSRPFSHQPGDHFFVPNAATRDAMARLRQLVFSRGSIAVVTGRRGVGKTALVTRALADLADQLQIVNVDLHHAPRGTDTLESLLLTLDPAAVPGAGQVAARLRRVLQGNTRPLVVVIDARRLNADLARGLLPFMHLAGDLSTPVNVIVQGPHHLHHQFAHRELGELRQRIAFRYRVARLTPEETERYIRYQISAAGGNPETIMAASLPVAVYYYVGGVPRLINTLLDATLCESALRGVHKPDGNLVKITAKCLGWEPVNPESDEASPEPGQGAPVATGKLPASPVQARDDEEELVPPSAMLGPGTGNEKSPGRQTEARPQPRGAPVASAPARLAARGSSAARR